MRTMLHLRTTASVWTLAAGRSLTYAWNFLSLASVLFLSKITTLRLMIVHTVYTRDWRFVKTLRSQSAGDGNEQQTLGSAWQYQAESQIWRIACAVAHHLLCSCDASYWRSVLFYRATTLCVSAVFAVAQCPSVRHVRVLYPEGWRYRQTVKLLSRHGSPITL